VALDVEAVSQPQGPKLVLGELAGDKAASLVAELGDPVVRAFIASKNIVLDCQKFKFLSVMLR